VTDPRTGLVAVAVRNPAGLVLVDARTLRVVRRIPLAGASRHLSLDSGSVLVPAERSNQLLIVRLPAGPVSAVRVGLFPHDAAAAGGRILVADERAGTVSVISGHQVIAALGSVVQPGGVASIGGDRVAVIDVRARRLAVYGLDPSRLIDRQPLGRGPTHIVAAAGRIFVADTGGNRVIELTATDRPTQVASARAPGAPYGIALDRTRRRLWVTLTASNQLVEYSTQSGALLELHRYPTVRQPDTVAIDVPTGRVFVTGRQAGVLEAIDPSQVMSLPTPAE